MFSHRYINEKILSTVLVFVKNNKGQLIKARALLDNGSMANFMTKGLCDKLNLKEIAISHTVAGINLSQTSIVSCVSTNVVST